MMVRFKNVKSFYKSLQVKIMWKKQLFISVIYVYIMYYILYICVHLYLNLVILCINIYPIRENEKIQGCYKRNIRLN